MRIFGSLLAVSLLTACQTTTAVKPYDLAPQPAVPSFTLNASSDEINKSNQELVNDFIDLTYYFESGHERATLAKWPNTVDVILDNPNFASYKNFTKSYLDQIKTSSGLDIDLLSERTTDTSVGDRGKITIEFASGPDMRSHAEEYFCFVVPGTYSWGDVKSGRNKEHNNWAEEDNIKEATIFIPHDAPPFMIRSCIHEEVAQALGPGNDLYRIAETIYNDDEGHLYATAFDMMMLKLVYDPKMTNGIEKEKARKVAKEILDAERPEGNNIVSLRPALQNNTKWKSKLLTAEQVFQSNQEIGLALMKEAISVANLMPSYDHRRAYTQSRYALMLWDLDTPKAIIAMQEAIDQYEISLGQDDVRTAIARVNLAEMKLENGEATTIIDTIDLALPVLADKRREDYIARALFAKSRAYREKKDAKAFVKTFDQALEWYAYSTGADDENLILAKKQLDERREDILASGF